MGWGCYRHEWDRGSENWRSKVAEITPRNCVPWGRDGEVCPACFEDALKLLRLLRDELRVFGPRPEIDTVDEFLDDMRPADG